LIDSPAPIREDAMMTGEAARAARDALGESRAFGRLSLRSSGPSPSLRT
jgi:hypothetical protein